MTLLNALPRETVEFLPVPITVGGVAVLTGVTFAVVAEGTRPATWVAPTTLDDEIGVMVSGFAPGYWRVFAKVASSPETPVIDCGYFQIT